MRLKGLTLILRCPPFSINFFYFMSDFKAIERNKDIGSNHSLLMKGLVPGIIYGKGTEPKKIALEDKILKKLMGTGSFYSTIIDLDVDGKKEKILPKQLQYHPVSDRLIHFDFLRVQENTKVNVCLLYTSPSPRDLYRSRMPSSA